MKKFFRRHQGRGSYNLFSSYSHYLPGIKEMVILLLLFIVGAVSGNLTVIGMNSFLGESFSQTYGTVVSYPIMFIPAMLYASVRSRLNDYSTPEVKLDRCDFNGHSGWTLALAGIASTVALAYVAEPIVTLLPDMPEWLENTMKQLLENCPVWITLISVSVFAPFFEEWLCRGIVLRGLLANKMHPAAAIAISSVFFALLHANPWQAIPAFLLGSLFGYVYYRTGSLKLTMLMHCTNNTLAVVFSKVPAFKDAETFMDVLSPWAYWCIYAACIVIVCCAVIIFRNFSGYTKTED